VISFQHAFAATVVGLFLVSQAAADPVRPTDQPPAAYTLDLGGVALTAISDGTVPQDLHSLMPGTPDATIDHLLGEAFLQNPVEASINVFLFRLSDRQVLVDTGAGQVFGPGFGGELPQALAAIGVDPDDITDILITHIHSDHSGGLTVNGERQFPNAVVHVAAADVEFFLEPANAERSGYDLSYFQQAVATVGPYVEAGQVQTFEAPAEILPGVQALPFPGHTPGSTVFRMTAGDQDVVFLGDLVHVEAVQFPQPDITITYDVAPAQAVESRRAAFEQLTGDRTLVAAPHLPFPGLGHIRTDGDGYRWVRTDFVDRAAQ